MATSIGRMKISVFGLGYVGTISAACLAHDGHQVIGVDSNPVKVAQICRGESPIVEPKLDDLVRTAVGSGNLIATTGGTDAVRQSDVSLICVGTPSHENGSLNLQAVETVCEEIGRALVGKDDDHVVVVRSTVVPGTIETRLVPLLASASGRPAGETWSICMNPEFLREGSAVEDYFAPSQIVIGAADQRSGDVVEQLYAAIDAPIVRTSIAAAEMIKYANNSFHALKIAFANEIGNLCKAHGIDGREVMEVLCRDRRLNISPAYLRPGFAFGGSCLPKDLRALLYRAKEQDVDCPLLSAILPSNELQIERGIRLVEQTGRFRVGILGLSFKAGTDDVRESPVVPLVETLVGRGYEVMIYDDTLELARLIGTNKTYLEQELPHIASLLRASADEIVAEAEVVVLTKTSEAFAPALAQLQDHQVLIDLAGVNNQIETGKGQYEGICW